MRHIRQVDLLDATDLAYIDGVIATLVRVRDAFLSELMVLVVLIVIKENIRQPNTYPTQSEKHVSQGLMNVPRFCCLGRAYSA